MRLSTHDSRSLPLEDFSNVNGLLSGVRLLIIINWRSIRFATVLHWSPLRSAVGPSGLHQRWDACSHASESKRRPLESLHMLILHLILWSDWVSVIPHHEIIVTRAYDCDDHRKPVNSARQIPCRAVTRYNRKLIHSCSGTPKLTYVAVVGACH